MAPDLLSTIRREIDERLDELRPMLAEYQSLLDAADALVTTGQQTSLDLTAQATDKPTQRKTRSRGATRGSAAGVIELAASASDETELGSIEGESVAKTATGERSRARRKPSTQSKTDRAVRGAAREAILAALDHGSHTVGELIVVTAMSTPNINGNLRRLVAEGLVMKTEREGKAAWALAETTA